MTDVVIIGCGPAGISAALYILRGGFSVTVIGKDNGALAKADKIENYYGLDRTMSGNELVETGIRQVENLGGTVLREEVVGISWNNTYSVTTTKNVYECKALILTTGTARKSAKIKNMDRLDGFGISYCAVCDGFLHRGKEVAVLGDGEYALHEVQELLNVVGHITLLTNGSEPKVEFPPEVSIITTPVKEVTGETKLDSIVFQDESSLHVSCLFVALGTAKGSDLARKLGIRLDNNKIMVNENMETGLPGVYAAGDCIGGILQVSVAVGEGAKAGLSCIQYLRKFS